MWELDKKKGRGQNWYLWTVALEKTLESPLDSKETKLADSKGNQPWIFIEGLTLKVKLQYFGHVMGRADSLENTLMLGKIEGRRRGWWRMRWLDGINGHEFEQAPGDGEGQESLVYCSPWGCKESDTTEGLNNNSKATHNGQISYNH